MEALPHSLGQSSLDQKKHNTGARIGIAFALSTLAAKLGIFGTIADVNAIVGPEYTVAQKIKGVFNKSFINKFGDKIGEYIAQGKSPTMAAVWSMKYTVVVSTVASIAAFAFGWMRAGRIENSKDVFKHPIRSTKIIFGLEEPSKLVSEKESSATVDIGDAPLSSGKWTDKVQSRESHQSAIQQEKSEQTAPSIN